MRCGPEELNYNLGFIVNLSKIKPASDVGRLGPGVLLHGRRGWTEGINRGPDGGIDG